MATMARDFISSLNKAVAQGAAKRAAAAREANWYKAQTARPLHISTDNWAAAIRAATRGLPCRNYLFFLVTNPHKTHPTAVKRRKEELDSKEDDIRRKVLGLS
ncbi:hypothetical protein FCM35_KLT17597 [Carex littledalei]|uniref:Uncharacterized protein n=1 Tax=Carex littledalei TaxID=544730 RepID=A0A833VRJ0_9POAL|nr:hypothetical protein FCM35_KLT17597 [Carex littledalei]